MNNILITICARAGSKGVKNKNIRDFLEYPLPFYTMSVIDLFIKSNKDRVSCIDIAVNTDSSSFLSLINKLSLPFIYVPRKPEMAKDTSSKIDVIKHSYAFCQEINHKSYDCIIDLDITSPLRTITDINNAVETLANDTEADLVYSVTSARRNPYFNMVMKEGSYYRRVIISDFTARQQAPLLFDMNASIYAYRSTFLDRNLSFSDGKALITIMKDTAILDIDSDEDLELMQVIAKEFYSRYPLYNVVKENISCIIK